jgi:hypothetical protein
MENAVMNMNLLAFIDLSIGWCVVLILFCINVIRAYSSKR